MVLNGSPYAKQSGSISIEGNKVDNHKRVIEKHYSHIVGSQSALQENMFFLVKVKHFTDEILNIVTNISLLTTISNEINIFVTKKFSIFFLC